jgi:hypothetical protein
MAHTLGPWMAVTYKVNKNLIGIYAESNSPICNIFVTDYDRDLANARLMAAAPLMLEALRAVEWIRDSYAKVDVCPWCMGTRLRGHRPDCHRQAALAAAEGEGE